MKLPTDPNSGGLCNNGSQLNHTACDYLYASSPDTSGIRGQEYKISTGFESLKNITSKAKNDGGAKNETNRFEL